MVQVESIKVACFQTTFASECDDGNADVDGGGAIGWRQWGYIWAVYVNGRCTRGRGQLEAPAGKKVGRG